MKIMHFWFRSAAISLSFALISLGVLAEILNPVEKIEKKPGFYHRREIRVEGFLKKVQYVPHGERAILIIDLADKKPELESEEKEGTDKEPGLKAEEVPESEGNKYLRCQDTGFNIGILHRIHDILKTEMKKGKKIRVKGKYDANLDLLQLSRIDLFRNNKKYEIDPNLGDVDLLELGKFPLKEYIIIKEGIDKRQDVR